MKTNATSASNTKIYIKFALILIASMAGGALAAFLFQTIASNFQFTMDNSMKSFMDYLSAGTIVGFNLIAAVYCFIQISKAKKLVKSWDGQDDDLAMEAENMLEMPLMVSGCSFILTIMLFGICCWLLLVPVLNSEQASLEISSMILFILSMLALLGNMVWTMAVQNMSVNLIKELNPEKQGSIFQTDFQKTWEASCDEMQKQEIYRAGFKAYQNMNKMCLAGWVLSVLTMFFFDTGLLPMILVCLIMLTGNLTYMMNARSKK